MIPLDIMPLDSVAYIVTPVVAIFALVWLHMLNLRLERARRDFHAEAVRSAMQHIDLVMAAYRTESDFALQLLGVSFRAADVLRALGHHVEADAVVAGMYRRGAGE